MENIYDPSYYRILCIGRNATALEIKAAWRGQMKVFHEDLNQNNPGAKETSQKLNEAYSILSDSEKRKKYDSSLNAYIRKKADKQREQAEATAKNANTKNWNPTSTHFTSRTQNDSLGLFGLFLLFLALAVAIFSSSNDKKLSDGKK